MQASADMATHPSTTTFLPCYGMIPARATGAARRSTLTHLGSHPVFDSATRRRSVLSSAANPLTRRQETRNVWTVRVGLRPHDRFPSSSVHVWPIFSRSRWLECLAAHCPSRGALTRARLTLRLATSTRRQDRTHALMMAVDRSRPRRYCPISC